jgi:hypothetical protein
MHLKIPQIANYNNFTVLALVSQTSKFEREPTKINNKYLEEEED